MNIFRRLSLYQLLFACGLVIAIGVSATALASAVGSGPTPPSKPLPEAVHDALGAPHVQGVTANIKLTNHLLEGASLASGGGQAGELASSPLLAGGSGRLWIAEDGRVRLELQAEKGDTELFFDGKTASLYDAANNTLYRYTVPAGTKTDTKPDTPSGQHEVPTVAKIEEAISNLKQHAGVSEATPTDVAGQPAYTVRVSPKETGSLIGGAELSFDAVHGVPLRAAIYSSSSASPVMELAATEISYGPVADWVFAFTPPQGAKVQDLSIGGSHSTGNVPSKDSSKPKVTTHGQGISAITVLEGKAKPGTQPSTSAAEGLPKVDINGAKASELRTALGTVLSFERSGVRYLVAGAVTPGAVEEVARGL